MNKSRSAKVNPRNVPRTQADVDRAYNKGYEDGVQNTALVFLYVIYNHPEIFEKKEEDQNMTLEDIQQHQVSQVHEIMDEVFDRIKQGYLSFSDVRRAIRFENETIVTNH